MADSLSGGSQEEGAGSNLKNRLGNPGCGSTSRQLAANMKTRLKRIQCRSGLIDGFLALIRLSTDSQPL